MKSVKQWLSCKSDNIWALIIFFVVSIYSQRLITMQVFFVVFFLPATIIDLVWSFLLPFPYT